MITPVPMSGRARGAWPLSHPPSLLSAPNLVLGEHALPAEIKQLSDGGNNMIYGTHKIRMNSACMCNWLGLAVSVCTGPECLMPSMSGWNDRC